MGAHPVGEPVADGPHVQFAVEGAEEAFDVGRDGGARAGHRARIVLDEEDLHQLLLVIPKPLEFLHVEEPYFRQELLAELVVEVLDVLLDSEGGCFWHG